ncbi:MAG: fibronectin type III domain-containing protein [Prevotella sp.]|nr:fibronectin type III domain-containing protein [Prevotella sp.]
MEKKMTSLMMGMVVMLTFAIIPTMAQKGAPSPSLDGVISMKVDAGTLLGRRMAQEAGVKNFAGNNMTHIQPMSMPKAISGSAFRGCVINDGGWSDGANNYGLYDLDPDKGTLTPAFIDSYGVMHADGGSTIVGNHYYFVTSLLVTGVIFYVRYDFNLETMEYEDNSKGIPGQSPSYLAWTNTPYDDETEKAYGLFFNADGTGLEFCSMDYASLTRKTIAIPQHTFIVMAIDDSTAQLYGIDTRGDLYMIDKFSGSERLVGSTGITPSTYHQAAAIDSAVGKLFWTFIREDNSSGVAEVDLATAETTVVCEFDRRVQFGDLYNTLHGVEGKAPGMVEHLSWNYNEADCENIDLAFTMPTKTNDGEEKLTGQLTYAVMLGEEIVAQGTAVPGGKVATTIGGLPQQQQLTLDVCVTNKVGNSQKRQVKVWAGPDVPMAPEEVTLSVVGNLATLTWKAVTLGEHGGYVDGEKVRYIVKKQPGGVEKANTVGTKFQEIVQTDLLDYITYSVQSVAEGLEPSIAAYSNRVKVGEYLNTPYDTWFETLYDAEGYWESVDANNDGVTWEYDVEKKTMRIAGGEEETNDWLISPPLLLMTGYEYSVKMTAAADFGGRVSMAYGSNSLTPPEGFQQLMEVTNLPRNFEEKTMECRFVPTTTGVCRIAIKAWGLIEGTSMEVRYFGISGPTEVMPPAAPTLFSVIPGEKGELSVTVSFKAPLTDVDGKELSHISSICIMRDGMVIETIENPRPGQLITYQDDKVPAQGLHLYAARANAYGVNGEEASMQVYVGEDVPALPKVAMVDNGDGTVTISWENSSKGAFGGYVDVSNLDNIVYNFTMDQVDLLPVPCLMNAQNDVPGMVQGEQVAYVEKGSSYTFTENLQGKPGWIVRGVSAVAHKQGSVEPQDTIGTDTIAGDILPIFLEGGVITDGGEVLANKFAMIDDQLVEGETAVAFLITGSPVLLPMEESFANMQVTTSEFWWWRQFEGSADWTLVDDDTDGDRGAAAFTALEDGGKALLGTRKISLKGTNHPMLSFDYKGWAEAEASLAILVDREQKGVVDTLAEISMDELVTGAGVERAFVDLADYIDDEYIILQFAGIAQDGGAGIVIDNVKVIDMPGQDLAAKITAPEMVMTGNKAQFAITVTNEGVNTSGDYAVKLSVEYMVDGKKASNVLLAEQGYALPAMGGKKTYTAQMDFTPFMLGEVNITAEVTAEGDENQVNNVAHAQMQVISVILPGTDMTMPAPEGLVAFESEDGIRLQWETLDQTIEYLTYTTEYARQMRFEYKGVNVYADGELFTTLTIAENETIIYGLEEGEHQFHITSLYGAEIDGEVVMLESPLSNKATFVTNIAQTMADNSHVGEVVVYTIGGAKVAEGVGSMLKLSKGTYIVVNKRTGAATRITIK